MKITFPAIFCLLVSSAAAIANPPFTVSPETTAITGPLRPDGSVDYVAALNARFGQGVTPDKNGFIDYIRAVGPKKFPRSWLTKTIVLLGAANLNKNDSGWKDFSGTGPFDRSEAHLWKAADFPAYANYLTAQKAPLDLAEQAAAKPQWWAPAVSINGTFAMILLPELNQIRLMSNALCARALLRVNQGDFDGFLADVIAVKRLTSRCDGYTYIGHLVGAANDYLADRTIGAAVGAGIFSSAQCAKLAAALDGLPPLTPLWDAEDSGERWSRLDFAQWIALGSPDLYRSWVAGNDARFLRRIRQINRGSVDWDSVMRAINGTMDQMRKILQSPTVRDEVVARQLFDLGISAMRNGAAAQPTLAPQPGETRDAYSQRIADAIITATLPNTWKCEDICRSELLEDQMTRALVAAGEYRADKGAWPNSPGDLVPAYLAQVPTEIFGEVGPVRYQKGDTGIRLMAHKADGSEISIGVGQQMPTDGL
jgi:hypothetical protein